MDRVPPTGVTMRPLLRVLPEGTELWRCHEHAYGPASFNPNTAHPYFGGNRFDATEQDPYPFLYAALDPVTALCEVLLRSVDFADRTAVRLVPWAQASRYTLSMLRTTRELSLVELTTAEGLAAVWQDSWLVDSEAADYPKTRYWVRLMREHAAEVHGLVWESKRCRPRSALQLFGDRCGEEPLAADPEGGLRLDSPEGVAEANRLLNPLRAVVSSPWPP
ncbi:RES family NAD+ phosphorylase [Streptomyces sp. ML-6]|uniref:RES family NAD+ phosphorylase n=1 Tax=Streptomyces sp. ML-6 TaxID=2982693 RepID=UPI0024BFC1F2|nr:RES family NAD+ phosphorylase [Streptomyces sp. ML-6]MDK0520679.1 RES family NAD+ phosphorylase [Streptomyces sp. ML-6]